MTNQQTQTARVACLLLTLLSVSAIARGETYYLSPDGDDRNEGSLDSPWRTLLVHLGNRRSDFQKVGPGDTVKLAPGIYDLHENALESSLAFRLVNGPLHPQRVTVDALDPKRPPTLTNRIPSLYDPLHAEEPNWVPVTNGSSGETRTPAGSGVVVWRTRLPVDQMYGDLRTTARSRNDSEQRPRFGDKLRERIENESVANMSFQGSYRTVDNRFSELVDYNNNTHGDVSAALLPSPWSDFTASNMKLLTSGERRKPQYIGPGLFFDRQTRYLYARLDLIDPRVNSDDEWGESLNPNETPLAVCLRDVDSLQLYNVRNTTFRNIRFEDIGGLKLAMNGSVQGRSESVRFDHCSFRYPGQFSIETACRDITLYDCDFDNVFPSDIYRSDVKKGPGYRTFHHAAILIGRNNDLPAEHVRVLKCDIRNSFFGISLATVDSVMIYGNEIKNATNDAILINLSAVGGQIAHNQIRGVSGISTSTPPGHSQEKIPTLSRDDAHAIWIHHNVIELEEGLAGRMTGTDLRFYATENGQNYADGAALDHDGDGRWTNRPFGSHGTAARAWFVNNNTIVMPTMHASGGYFAQTAISQKQPFYFVNNVVIQPLGQGRLNRNVRLYDRPDQRGRQVMDGNLYLVRQSKDPAPAFYRYSVGECDFVSFDNFDETAFQDASPATANYYTPGVSRTSQVVELQDPTAWFDEDWRPLAQHSDRFRGDYVVPLEDNEGLRRANGDTAIATIRDAEVYNSSDRNPNYIGALRPR
ncbi:MAG: right-handed parallel beta-helix repeat-containing protein [Planctomycetota bacterium]